MDSPKAPNYRRLAILAVLFLIVSLALLFWARDVIRETVVLPLSYIFFVIGVLINYTPQIFFWIVVLLLAARIAYLSVARKKKADEAELMKYINRPLENRPVTSGRVMYWANKVHLLQSGRGIYYTHTFHEALSKMLFQLLAYRNRLTVMQVEEGLKDGSLNIPPDIRAYALESLGEDMGGKERSWDAIRDWISTMFGKVFLRLKTAFQKAAGGPGSPQIQAQSLAPGLIEIDAQVRRILNYMEEELEVPHDNTGR